MVCLYISQMEPTTQSLAIFVGLMYLMYPLVITNKLGTSLMLDRIVPTAHRGFFQGMHVTINNVCQAIAPFVLGMISDTMGVPTMMYIVCGISVLGGIAKIPLVFVESLRKTQAKSTEHTVTFATEPTSLGISTSSVDEEQPSSDRYPTSLGLSNFSMDEEESSSEMFPVADDECDDIQGYNHQGESPEQEPSSRTDNDVEAPSTAKD